MDLIDTGSLVNNIRVSPLDRDEIEIYSTDGKYVDISKKYGDDNFNITDAETSEVNKTAEYAAMVQIFNDIYK